MTSYTEEEVLLSIENVSKEYNGKLVLKNVSANIKDIKVANQITGQIVGFIGPSGIGKSTLFRIMAGLEAPTSGSVKLAGEHPVKAGDVGVVAQNYPLFGHRTVLGNLLLAASRSKTSREQVVAYLNDFDLIDVINKYPSQLSGGQRQRCAIIQQVLCSNHYILMDEPFSGLDPIAKRKTQVLIQKIANLDELNTIIIVTHDISAIAEIADHLWVMGRQREADGKAIPGSSIVQTYNLIDKGFAYRYDLKQDPEFLKFITYLDDSFTLL